MATIALVDDDRDVLALLATMLESEGYDVVAYPDGPAALDGLKTVRPDLAILDLKMPQMDGVELLGRLRQKSDVPVIFLTGRLDEVDEVLGLRIGADDFIRKPFSQRVLIERVRTVLRRVHGPAAASDRAGDNVIEHGDLRTETSRSSEQAVVPVPMEEATQAEEGFHQTVPKRGAARKAFMYLSRVLLGMTCALSIVFTSVMYAAGSSWFATHILDYLVLAACIAVVLCTLGMLPVVQGKVSKIGLLYMFLTSSYLFAMTTWLLGAFTTLQRWGWIGVLIGACVGIVGVVPLGIAAAAMSADWSIVAIMIIGALVAYGARDIALGLAIGPEDLQAT